MLNHYNQEIMMIVREALGHATIDEMRINVLKLVKRAFNCDAASYFIVENKSRSLGPPNLIYDKFDHGIMRQYCQYFHKIDPFYQNALFFPPVAAMSELIPQKEYKDSEYYNDFYKKLRIDHQLILVLRSGTSLIGGLCLQRTRDSRVGIFTSRDKYKAGLLVPYLSEITEKYITLKQIQTQVSVLESIAAELPYKGKIVIDDSFNPFYIDGGAFEVLNSLNGGSQDDKLDFLIKEIQFHMQKYCKSDSWHELERSIGKSRLILHYNRQRIEIILRSIETREGLKFLSICLEPVGFDARLEANINKLLQSQRHREVARLILQGFTNCEIADKLFISLHTVNNHLNSMYKDLNVNNRTSFMSKLIDCS